MAHNPVNHPLRPVYRALGGLTGLYLLVFGILGAIQTADAGLFGHSADRVLGQGTNLGWSVASAVAGLAVLAATALGRNIDVAVNTYLGWGLLVVGLAMMALLRTDANILNFSMITVLVSFVAGLLLITAGLYGRVAVPAQAAPAHRARQRA